MIYVMKQEMRFCVCDSVQKVIGDIFLLGVFLILCWTYSASPLVPFVILYWYETRNVYRHLYFSWKILYPFSLASMGSYMPSL